MLKLLCGHNTVFVLWLGVGTTKTWLGLEKNIIIWLKMPVSVNTIMHGDGHCSCQNYSILLQQKRLKNVQRGPKNI